jgi:flavin-dependent dehydrogenase
VPVKRPTADTAARFGVPLVSHRGNLIPHRLRPAVEDGCFFVGDSAGHCFALSAEGIRGALYFGLACGRELRRVLEGETTRDEALAAYAAFSARHRRDFGITYALQLVIPALPPRVLTGVIRVLSRQALVDAIFNWYLGLLPPASAHEAAPAAGSDRRELALR